MPPRHLDRLPATDASFLAQERGSAHMQVGALAVFAGPPPSYEELVAHIQGRLHLVPRYRQKLAFPRFQPDRPFWIDDPFFNLRYHVRDTALPAPGSEAQLRALAARVHSQALDRSKPLWETWLVQGLEGGRFALLSKTHHALVDGVAGVDLATVLFDTTPVPAEVEHADTPWHPRPTPSGLDMVARGVRGLVALPFEAAGRAVGAAARPGETLHGTREALEGLGEVVWAGMNAAPETPSTSAWWVLETTAKRSSPTRSTSHSSHSGLERSSAWANTRPARRRRASSPAGAGSALWRTW